MKKLLFGFSLFSLLSLNACKTSEENTPSPNMLKAESILDFDCIRTSADVSRRIADVKKEIYGEWQLKGMITMMPSFEVPDLKIVISQKSDGKQLAQVYENGKLTKAMTYDLVEDEYNKIYYVGIKSDKDKFDDGSYNFITGNIRICPGELMIDNGIALDAPGYLFRKIK
ncbi:hypothetical protein [Emticicia agri]|uniref:Lipocalin-like domain-containing protein n=1 Tax=Emticicia agri TaxID=2492393 RepID=A0A4Q5LTW0_9BACT|nr:hypothetical protein [Emticicia agri]RYU92873.1 hypothetical protein EWM59_24860 [Emticicia agri]